MDLITNYKTQDIVKKYGFNFTKSLGQNFLVDKQVVLDIVDGAEIGPEDFVIEIGPGVGTLTVEMLKRAKKVTSIEIDKDLIPILTEELKDYDNFELIHKDALKANFDEIIGDEKSVKVAANLPYYVTTPLIAQLLKSGAKFQSITIMIQKEVADRMDAKPNTRDYGSLSLMVQYYATTKVIRTVAPSSFMPRPKVESIIIRLDRLEAPRVKVQNEEFLFTLIRDVFNMRRKTLWNGVKNLGVGKEDLEKAFVEANVDPKRRGETLTIEEFATLADKIYAYKIK
ncbi:MAG: 16S rRNA (adenine(1518)-N(6)/adenine(1519)-N(6))-dimethyltransferase RsmA [Clostridium sp.]|uniref:16S rRNA (adenine(1518)-N(6)/adenine(1519)-N(6))- dimethyltransferase RsmA n=1 Tax=Clostridium sp. TaxID=1506 RepID=UPI003EE47395